MSEQKGKSDLRWESPPKGNSRGKYDWAQIAKQLEARPGEWALIFEDDLTSLVNSIRVKGVRALLPANGFEVRTANNVREPVRRCTLWLRYNPEKDERSDH